MTEPLSDATLARLEDQIKWYNDSSIRCKRWFKSLKISAIASAVAVPLCAGLSAPAILTGGLGCLIAVLEGLQQLNQFDHNWITYRSTCESLKHEKFLYFAKAGPYSQATDAHSLLAERIESLISQEHAKWVSAAEQSTKTGKPPSRTA